MSKTTPKRSWKTSRQLRRWPSGCHSDLPSSTPGQTPFEPQRRQPLRLSSSWASWRESSLEWRGAWRKIIDTGGFVNPVAGMGTNEKEGWLLRHTKSLWVGLTGGIEAKLVTSCITLLLALGALAHDRLYKWWQESPWQTGGTAAGIVLGVAILWVWFSLGRRVKAVEKWHPSESEWEKKAKRYKVFDPKLGVYVMILREQFCTDESEHYLCRICFDKKVFSTLLMYDNTKNMYRCPTCSNQYFNFGEYRPRKWAEATLGA